MLRTRRRKEFSIMKSVQKLLIKKKEKEIVHRGVEGSDERAHHNWRKDYHTTAERQRAIRIKA